jgi:DNA-binding transcriptional ArsR family regulator
MSGNGGNGASDFSDLESLRARDTDIPASKVETPSSKRIEEKRRRQFIMVPMDWVDRLARIPHRATFIVALRLLRLAWQHPHKSVTLSNIGLAELGVARAEKYRALAELGAVGLITVERSKGKAPRVTLLKV